MSILDELPMSVSTKRRTRTRTSLGGSKDSFVTTTGVRCWQQSASDREITEYGRRGISITDKFYFTADPSLTERDVIVGTDGRTYEIRSFSGPDASAGLGVVYRIMAEYKSTTV